jgi:hypothetical protein
MKIKKIKDPQIGMPPPYYEGHWEDILAEEVPNISKKWWEFINIDKLKSKLNKIKRSR